MSVWGCTIRLRSTVSCLMGIGDFCASPPTCILASEHPTFMIKVLETGCIAFVVLQFIGFSELLFS